jgi:IclR family acetate operon transcriptional repressor
VIGMDKRKGSNSKSSERTTERRRPAGGPRSPKEQNGGDQYTVPALARAFEMLDMLSMSSVGLIKMDFARKLKIPYSSIFNLLTTMEKFGFVRRDEDTGKYYLGLKLLSLAGIPSRELSLRDMIAPLLQEMVRATGVTGHLAILDRGEAVYIDRVEPDSYIKINTWIGKRNFIHSSAVGKALVAFRSEGEINELLHAGLPKRTPHTITTVKRLRQELARVRTVGYATDQQEDERGGFCVAAPIFNASGTVVAALGLSAVATQLPASRFPELGETVRTFAARASVQMGYTGAYPPGSAASSQSAGS